jgi:hypothetical protein
MPGRLVGRLKDTTNQSPEASQEIGHNLLHGEKSNRVGGGEYRRELLTLLRQKNDGDFKATLQRIGVKYSGQKSDQISDDKIQPSLLPTSVAPVSGRSVSAGCNRSVSSAERSRRVSAIARPLDRHKWKVHIYSHLLLYRAL